MRHASVRTTLIISLAIVAIVPFAPPAEAATLPSGFSESTVSGLNRPTAMAFAPDGRLFVVEKAGAIRIIDKGVLRTTPFATLTVDTSGERGLGSVAVPPDFATSHRLYVYYTVPTPAPHNVVAWFGGANGTTATSGPNVVVSLPDLDAAVHNGGAMQFGKDGQLYVAVGENGKGAPAQDLTSPLGKLLRVTPSGAPSAGNPSFGGVAHDPRVWAYGFRNPFTSAIDRRDGTIYINDVGSAASGACGSGTWEEVNVAVAGANYGWPLVEGPASTPQCSKPGLTYPLYAYPHTDDSHPCAIAGGALYAPPGAALMGNSFVGAYFFADLCAGWIKYRLPSGTVRQLATNVSAPVDIETGPDGALYYLAFDSQSVGRISSPWNVFLRGTPTSGFADAGAFAYGGRATDQVLFCDWDGNGTETIGVHRGSQWVLQQANENAWSPDVSFQFGDPSDVPVCGDWDGDGTDTVGVRRGYTFYLRNTNTSGYADTTAAFGDSSDVGLVGDWDGDGTDTVGVHRGATFYLRNTNTSGFAEVTFLFGDPGDQPLVGDWDGNATDTIAVHRGNTFYFRNTNTAGYAESTATFGDPGDIGAAGNWDGVGGDGIGVVR